jgi:hypothetical protein
VHAWREHRVALLTLFKQAAAVRSDQALEKALWLLHTFGTCFDQEQTLADAIAYASTDADADTAAAVLCCCLPCCAVCC